MGTDMYLEWDKMTEDEEGKRMTGFSINAGEVGYIRASIGMHTENAILRTIFPNEYWEGKRKRYIFNQKGYDEVRKLGIMYLLFKLGNREISYGDEFPTTEDLKDIGKQIDFEDKERNIRYAAMWVNSLYSFYELGMLKEKEKKHPKVIISW